MRVFDTNIWVAALSSRQGASYQLLQFATQGEVTFAVSVALALEYEAVLMRVTRLEQSWASATEIMKILDLLFSKANLVMPIRTRLRPSAPDPADEMVLECAVQCGADAIVTMNIRDLKVAARHFRIDIESPGGCLNNLKSGEIG